jgi:UDP-N-acetylglucosamine 2-epimerase (non-hydrolysing)
MVKIAPILRIISASDRLLGELVHTGQHYDSAMSEVFFRELEIDPPTISLHVGSGTHAEQTGAVMRGLESAINERQPDLVVTVGDVNSTLAAALVAAKAGIPQAHVEAGLRSGDASMPEEVNRVVADRLADLLFTHSAEANRNLQLEGVPAERIHFVGNVMIDTLLRLKPRWQGTAADVLGRLPDAFGTVTLHRPSNVDDPASLHRLMGALATVARRIPLIFPVHPRTRERLGAATWPGVRLVEPLGYLSFMDLLEHSRVVLTDSGGIQEETTMLGVPCLTLRDNTERPITLRAGTNQLVGTDPANLVDAVDAVLGRPSIHVAPPPLWDGRASGRIVDVLAQWLDGPHPLRLAE